MANYVHIDGGTSNTRIFVTVNGTVSATRRLPVGAKASIDGSKPLRAALARSISELLCEARLTEGDISYVIASGMIGSEHGLAEVPHLTAPAGISELRKAVFKTEIKDVSQIPFAFIRGVRLVGKRAEDCDVMRGEETELFGLFDKPKPNSVCILPGSHSKIIRLDGECRICDFSTLMTGEMVAALSEGTILRDAVELSDEAPDEAALLRGFDYCRAAGLNKALFKVRIMKNLFGAKKSELYGFFLGAILEGEIREAERMKPESVVIGGRAALKNATATLLSQRTAIKALAADDEAVSLSVVKGQIRIIGK